jgi:glycosyltransferase involved in cell wall biosynthesis
MAVRVVHVVESLGLGGLERVVEVLARRASPRFAVEILALSEGGRLMEELRAEGVPVHRLGLPDYYPKSILRAARAMVSARADVVHTHGHFAGVVGRLAARLVGLRAVLHHLHTVDSSLRRRHLRLERLLGRVTRRVLCCSSSVARHAQHDLGLPEPLLELVPNGVEPAPQVARDDVRLKPFDLRPPVVGCVASLRPHKGQAVLMRAFACLPESLGGTLVLVGEGPERSRLERLGADLGLVPRLRMPGERLDARLLLAGFDLLVAPSIGREGLGVSVLEGMDAGLPVVASRVGGLPEVVEEGRTGLLVPEDDPAALAAAMTTILSRDDRGAALGAEGRRRVESQFRASAMVRRVESLYEVALERTPRAA